MFFDIGPIPKEALPSDSNECIYELLIVVSALHVRGRDIGTKNSVPDTATGHLARAVPTKKPWKSRTWSQCGLFYLFATIQVCRNCENGQAVGGAASQQGIMQVVEKEAGLEALAVIHSLRRVLE
ncbi:MULTISPECIES: hypothetical protein [Sinorhizobium]|uniref:hypothetical protein n=1 Tax=Sinorhizobium TaxID=28105 RepID=UPI00138A5D27|nr:MULTISPECIES: hypothetical protein [Sinorhizobium]